MDFATPRRAFKTAFPLTVPIAAGFLFLGCSYGLLMHAKGFAFWYPVAMAYFIFAGSMEFVTVNLLLSAFAPVSAFLLALMVNARHLFYGLAMLGRFRGLGWKKPYLIFAMCDETFAINSSARIPDDVDRGWFMMTVSLLNRWYWIIGTALGWLVGGLLPFDTKGIEFVLTALFATIFLDQWMDDGSNGDKQRHGNKTAVAQRKLRKGFSETLTTAVRVHMPAMVGVLASAVCLMVFGANRFMIPAMTLMLVLFVALRPYLDRQPETQEAAAHDESGEAATTGKEASL
ncbi:AzlC family ABC transporter permease [Bifidobacterium leontopitheci]|uniref:Branched-chain amino acid transport protein n=1 Tax=Bifidobacterium leontopitheci TaxID=2650774 RepID=A0A6I1GKY1_9BIFI|nr:AzlC family ABC transporter permease [Bifidobacterium leontopitheci]KAB7790296.1 branched-chain amino acid transport protein [Bifidobacterium leontopitheci]